MREKYKYTIGLLASVILLLALTGCPSTPPTTIEDITKLQEQNQFVLVQVVSYNCRACAAQKEDIQQFIENNPKLKPMLTYVQVDFYQDIELHLAPYYYSRPSTLIIYKGRDEINRTVGETNPAVLSEFIITSMTNPIPRRTSKPNEYTPTDLSMQQAADKARNAERMQNSGRSNAQQNNQTPRAVGNEEGIGEEQDTAPVVNDEVGE